MNIAICDDEKAQADLLARLVHRWGKSRGVQVRAEIYYNAESLLYAWAESGRCDALLLDIQMPAMNGMELARKIRQRDESIAIIFITGYSDYMQEGYDVSALHYLLKPIDEAKLFACLDRAGKQRAEDKSLILDHGGQTVRLAQSEILSIEAFAHEVHVVSVSGVLTVRKSIGEVADGLDASLFIRPHRSYVVGLRFVQQIGKSELLLDNGTRIPVSRRKYGEINRAFIDFYRGIRP